MTERHMSIDIETLDTEEGAAVIAIGAVIFEKERRTEEETFEVLIDPVLAPGTRNRSTWDWWMGQDTDVRERMLSGTVSPWDACTRFAAFCTLDVDHFWGNPARFDCGHLRSMFNYMELEFPFAFYQERDLSTVKWMAKQIPDLKGAVDHCKEKNESPHDALSDALAQAEMIRCALLYFHLE